MKRVPLAVVLVCFLVLATFAFAAPMRDADITEIWPASAPLAAGDRLDDIPTLQAYLPKAGTGNGAAFIICPGGGYQHLAVGHEGKDVGEWLAARGVAGFVLRYRLSPRYHHSAPFMDVQRAIRFLRVNAADLKLNPNRIGVMGFSAGGHLASTLATHWDLGDPNAADPFDRVSCRPDLQVLGYPVITMTSGGSAKALLGDQPPADLLELLSNENHVDAKTPPAFIFHSTLDKSVPIAVNSDAYVDALKKAGVPVTYIRGEIGGHGFGMNDKWVPQWHAWLLEQGWIAPATRLTSMFNGQDLSGWKGLVADPIKRAKMTTTQLADAQSKADDEMRAHWHVADGELVSDGKGPNLCTTRPYGDFEMYVDWKIPKNGDSGIYLRGSPQVQIWDPENPSELRRKNGNEKGSGGLWNNQKYERWPLVKADKPIGEWNTFRIIMVGERVWVWLNGQQTVDGVMMENYWDRKQPIFAKEQLELQTHGDESRFRNLWVREIAAEEAGQILHDFSARAATRPAGVSAGVTVHNVSPDEYEAMAKQPGVVLLDVRTPEEYFASHIPGAVNLDIMASDFDQKVAALDKGKTYLVSCATGGRSAAACKRMAGMEFVTLYNLDGGFKAWMKAGKPTTRSAN